MTDRIYRLVIHAALGVFAALGLRIDVQGAEHLPREGGMRRADLAAEARTPVSRAGTRTVPARPADEARRPQ